MYKKEKKCIKFNQNLASYFTLHKSQRIAYIALIFNFVMECEVMLWMKFESKRLFVKLKSLNFIYFKVGKRRFLC